MSVRQFHLLPAQASRAQQVDGPASLSFANGPGLATVATHDLEPRCVDLISGSRPRLLTHSNQPSVFAIARNELSDRTLSHRKIHPTAKLAPDAKLSSPAYHIAGRYEPVRNSQVRGPRYHGANQLCTAVSTSGLHPAQPPAPSLTTAWPRPLFAY